MNLKQIVLDAFSSIFSNPNRDYTECYPKVDNRKKAVKAALAAGFTKEKLAEMKRKSYMRMIEKKRTKYVWNTQTRKEFLEMVNKAEFDLNATSSRYNCTGVDWCAYHRPTSDGKGWVLIAPDEPSNNIRTTDKILVEILSKRFLNK